MENVVLVGAITPSQNEIEVSEYLQELEFLTDTAGGCVVKIFKQKIERIHSKTFLGKGKITSISEFIKKTNIDTAIFDDELSNFHYETVQIESSIDHGCFISIAKCN